MVDTIRTEQQLLTTAFQDGQAPNSITAQDMRDFVVSSKYLNPHGWQFFFDSAYDGTNVPTSARTITGGSREQVTIDGLTETLGHPPGGPSFWDTTTNKVVPSGLNDFGILRLAFTAQKSLNTDNWIEVELDTGGAFPIIWKETATIVKASSDPQSFNFIIPLFSGPDFQANGGTFYITPTETTYFWEFALTAVRIYAAFPA